MVRRNKTNALFFWDASLTSYDSDVDLQFINLWKVNVWSIRYFMNFPAMKVSLLNNFRDTFIISLSLSDAIASHGSNVSLFSFSPPVDSRRQNFRGGIRYRCPEPESPTIYSSSLGTWYLHLPFSWIALSFVFFFRLRHLVWLCFGVIRFVYMFRNFGVGQQHFVSVLMVARIASTTNYLSSSLTKTLSSLETG